MPRRYWLPAIAAGLAFLLSAQSPNGQRIAAPRPAVKEQAANTPDPKTYPTARSPLPVRIIQSAGDAEHAQAREAKSDKHEAEDLQTQKRAADAAEKQIFPAWLGAFLTFLGTGLLVWTLAETRSANAIARKALKIAQQTDRPHMLVGSLKLVGFRDTSADAVKVNYMAKNWGKSPAFIRSVALEAEIFGELPAGTPHYANRTPVHHVLSEGGHIEFKGPGAPAIILSYPQRIEILGGLKFLLVFGRVEYADVHGISHVNRWSYLFRPGQNETEDSWSVEAEGIGAAYREYT